MVKSLKLCSECLHGDTDRRCSAQMSWNLSDGKVVKSCVICLTEKKTIFGCLSNCRYWANRGQNLPGKVPNIWLTLFQISSISVHFRQSY